MPNLGWFDARDLARTGKAIRRETWRKWLVRGVALWYVVEEDDDGFAQALVVLNSEFGAADFIATDWTDAAWSGGAPPPTGVAATAPRLAGGRTFGTRDNPPAPSSIFQPSGSAGSEYPRPMYAHHAPSGQPVHAAVELLPMEALNRPITVYARVSILGGPPADHGNMSIRANELQWTLDPANSFNGYQTGPFWPGFSRLFAFPNITIASGQTCIATLEYTYTGFPLYRVDDLIVTAFEPPQLYGLAHDPLASRRLDDRWDELTPAELVGGLAASSLT